MSRHITARQLADLRRRAQQAARVVLASSLGPNAAQLALGSALVALLHNPHLMQVRNLERIHRALGAMGRPVVRATPTLADLRVHPSDMDRYVISFLDPHGGAWRVAAPTAMPETLLVKTPTGAVLGRPSQILGYLRGHFDYRRLLRLMDQLRNWRPPAGP